jgi:hypothetical protein
LVVTICARFGTQLNAGDDETRCPAIRLAIGEEVAPAAVLTVRAEDDMVVGKEREEEEEEAAVDWI